METLTRSILEWHMESEPFPTELQSGDCGEVVVRDQDGFAFALDALGHGPEAARIAERARDHLLAAPANESLENLFLRCHEHMRGTRGIALCLAKIDAVSNTLTWLSVGNIQAVHIHVDSSGLPSYESLIMRGGVVGDRLPELRSSRSQLSPGDLVVLASDGIGHAWHTEFRPDITPHALAGALMKRHRVVTDDAMALALRYDGGEETHHGG